MADLLAKVRRADARWRKARDVYWSTAEARRAAIVEAYENGDPIKEIAAACEVGHEPIRRIIRETRATDGVVRSSPRPLPTTGVSALDIVTLVVAIAGFGLGLASLVWNVVAHLASGVRVDGGAYVRLPLRGRLRQLGTSQDGPPVVRSHAPGRFRCSV